MHLLLAHGKEGAFQWILVFGQGLPCTDDLEHGADQVNNCVCLLRPAHSD